MAEVKLQEGESIESALRRFKRKVEKSGILTELRKRQHFEKPSVKRKRKAIQARKKIMRKLLEERRQGLAEGHARRLDVDEREEVDGEGLRLLDLRIDDRSGQFIGVLRLARSSLPDSLLARLGRGDRGLFERMDAVSEPARRPAAILFADLEAKPSGFVKSRGCTYLKTHWVIRHRRITWVMNPPKGTD